VEVIVSTTLTRAEPLTKGREIKIDIEPELPVVRVDERAVSEVIYTLIENAAKYSPDSTSIGITAQRSANGMIEMSVEDHGMGIPEDLRERVFDKFFRATRDGDVRNQPSGTGMGLAIAKGIIEAHDGRIWIESGADQKGTRVRFTVPIGDDDVEEVG
jgi:two-component system sensor histidine kinase KdpD